MAAFRSSIRTAKPPNLFFFPSNSAIINLKPRRLPINASSVDHRIRVYDASGEKSLAYEVSNDHRNANYDAAPSSTEAEKVRVSEELRKDMMEALEWDSLCSQISAFVSTSFGRVMAQSSGLPVGRDQEESEKLLDQTAAVVALPEPLDFSGIEDVSEIVAVAVGGEMLRIQELCAVERTLKGARRVFEQLERLSAADGTSNRYFLLSILQNCDFLTELTNKLGFCINCTLSLVLDQASTKLESIRLQRRNNMERLESLLKELSTKVFQAGGIDSPLITTRRSRMCIGIKASHKYLLPEGVILSTSSSGATYFVEPRDAVELNNMEVRLLNDEKSEEFAILGLLTSEISEAETKIRHLLEKILELDLAAARGAHALWIGGVRPHFTEDYENSESDLARELLLVDIEGIRHPLLFEPSLTSLSSFSVKDGGISKLFDLRDGLRKFEGHTEGEIPVAIDIKIKPTTKVVVISGPNTGGKTASMKTLGLASLMSKAGMFLPANDRPRLPWFRQILVDIGDHQSLEHNLSTFSGHISRLCKIIEVTSRDSLVLIDEIGCGTDPTEGVALSKSILQHLVDHVRLSVVTTHYADLSRLKASDSRFENAAMEFCEETLQPTYRILWGSTGTSNALSIAKSIGFDQKVLDRAHEWLKNLVPDKQMERQGLLYQSLSEERNLLQVQANEAASILEEVKKLHLEINSEAEDLDSRIEALKAKEFHSVQADLKTVRSQMDSIIKNFEKRLQSATLDQLSSILREHEAAITSVVVAHHPTDDMSGRGRKSTSAYIPQIGDKVYVNGLGDKVATVVEAASANDITLVQYGKIKMRVKRDDMKLIQRSTSNEGSSSSLQLKRLAQRFNMGPSGANKDESASFGPVVRTSKNTVDLRGKRLEEAAHYLHMAISGSKPYGVLFIVHGTGTGAVKECVLGILKDHPRVAKFEEESPMNYGCTVAYIK